MAPGPSIQDYPPNASGSSDERLKQAAVYAAAGVVGIGAGVNELHHEYYKSAKDWPELQDARDTRREGNRQAAEAVKEANLPMKERFSLYHQNMKAPAKAYEEAVGAAMEARGIYSTGLLKKWTLGSVQRWKDSGEHTRRGVVFNLLGTGLVTLIGGMIAIRPGQNISHITGKPEKPEAGHER